MFTDRWWILKTASALLLFSAVCYRSGELLNNLYPPLERAALFTDDLRERTMLLWGKQVLAADATGFEVPSRAGPIRVLTPNPPPVGVIVSTVARPVGPRTLTASSYQINAGWRWKRPLNYLISIFVVIGYLWAVRGRFRWRIEEGVFRGRY